MFLRSLRPPPRCGIGRAEVIVVGLLIALGVALLVPKLQHVRVTDARSYSMHNLKNISLVIHSFHDVNKRLPFNGTTDAVSNEVTSGSWAFQILPFVDEQPLYVSLDKSQAVRVYLHPERQRPIVEENLGAWTDYFINNYINNPESASTPNSADKKVNLNDIKDGTSNTVLVGEGNISKNDYAKTRNVVGSCNIFVGGTHGTMRGGPTWRKGQPLRVTLQRDSADVPDLTQGGWGGPFSQGALMAMADATVRMFPYSMDPEKFGALLTPNGGEKHELPD